jgi:Ser/Thr protein kinase RdoA (MazF antagonist)
MPAFKTIDDKGRLTLGREFAGRTVQVEKDDDGILIKFYRVVPDREAWLWENETARDLVERGIAAAASGALTDGPPDLAASFKFADSIPEE